LSHFYRGDAELPATVEPALCLQHSAVGAHISSDYAKALFRI